ncbi:MAG TPA: GTPase HflX, partial [Candidatus Absconditabacterales bacterium]|nr:GTPase HflX [Candidatus Absconditabacterales bacterium]
MEENKQALRVFLVDIVNKDITPELLEDRMNELESLLTTYGGLVVLKKFQKKDQPDYHTYIGKGKLEEIMADMMRLDSNLLIIGNVLKPSQIYHINELLRPIGATVRDRVDLILKIFDKHATSMESRLQVELAAIRHMGPRIFGMGMELSKQGGNAGGGKGAMRGIGETNTEIMKRHLKYKVLKIEKELKEYEQMRKLHRESRIRKGMPTVGIVGYTNTGKSSLLNAMTKKGILAENKLFATLGTHVGKVYIMKNPETGEGKEILLNDTIGFIRDLPPKLIKSFSSTLEDSIESDLLLHVIDASDPFVDERISIVNHILDEIGAKQKRIMLFNKIDLLNKNQLTEIKKHFPDKKN